MGFRITLIGAASSETFYFIQHPQRKPSAKRLLGDHLARVLTFMRGGDQITGTSGVLFVSNFTPLYGNDSDEHIPAPDASFGLGQTFLDFDNLIAEVKGETNDDTQAYICRDRLFVPIEDQVSPIWKSQRIRIRIEWQLVEEESSIDQIISIPFDRYFTPTIGQIVLDHLDLNAITVIDDFDVESGLFVLRPTVPGTPPLKRDIHDITPYSYGAMITV